MDIDKAIAAWDTLEAGLHKRTAPYHKNPSEEWIDPFRILGDLYYVGDKIVASHLLDTGDGLLLIDTCFPHTRELLVKRIEFLGFSPADIRFILHTHEHFDHFGATHWLQITYGCKTFIHKDAAETFRIHPHHTELQSSFCPDAALFVPDVEFSNGEVIQLGKYSFECVQTPGHSAGASAFFFDIEENGEKYRVGLCGVNGNLPLHKGRLLKYGIPLSTREQYLASIKSMMDREVDITIDTHPRPDGVLDMHKKQVAEPESKNPFIDPSAWCRSHEDYLKRFDGLIARENEELGVDGEK